MVVELSVHLPNRPGRFAQVLNALAEENVNVLAFSVDQEGVYSVLKLVCYPLDRAKQQLEKYGFSYMETELIAVCLTQEPNQLFPIAETLGANGINIEYGYLTLRVGTNKAIVLLGTNNPKRAKELLIRDGYFVDEDLKSWVENV